MIYAGAPMATVDQRRARDVLGDALIQYYGLAEVTGNITVLPGRCHQRPAPDGVDFGSCGYPRTGMQVSIQDDAGTEVAAGPLWRDLRRRARSVRADTSTTPSANEAAFRDGWFRTGDIGFVDDEGFLYITGRLSDMYISGGSNVHPRDIEEKLLSPPSRSRGRRLRGSRPEVGRGRRSPCAWSTRAPDSRADELRSWLDSRMARYKVPKSVAFWTELPRSGYGKVQRRTIRELYLQGDEART